MHVCDYCGKILHELPYKCRRCGQEFCSDHHLPENHHCHGHHHHDSSHHRKICGNCGRVLTGLPFKCHRCEKILCDDCRLPENHGCSGAYNPPFPPKQFIEKRHFRNSWAKIRDSITLKNFTIISLALILISFLPSYYPMENARGIFQSIFVVGLWCFLLAYFLYAVKCWGGTSQLCAVLMVGIPVLVYSLATAKIPGTVTNIWLYLIIQFGLYTIISAIILYISDKVKTGMEGILRNEIWRSHRYFIPHVSYAFVGMILVSFVAANAGSSVIFSDNSNSITEGIPKYQNSNNQVGMPVPTYQGSQILPTIAPDIVNDIEKKVGNPAPEINVPSLERRIHELINQQRNSHGLSSLNFDPSLSSIARGHSADMAKNSFFSHYNLQGLGPDERGNQAGYSCYKNYGSYYTTGIAENIMQDNLFTSVTYYNGIPVYDWNSQEELAQSTVSGWMSSPGHRQNILTSTYDREGIGVAIAADKKVYVTEDFC